MMLRESGQDVEGLNLQTIVDGESDSGVPHGAELVAFVEAALARTQKLPSARTALAKAMDAQAVVDAAAVIGNFQRMTRIADATGIPVDERTAAITVDIRADLGLETFASTRLP